LLKKPGFEGVSDQKRPMNVVKKKTQKKGKKTKRQLGKDKRKEGGKALGGRALRQS